MATISPDVTQDGGHTKPSVGTNSQVQLVEHLTGI